ncbi:MAG: hypothetical protein IKM27_08025 [Clostridia bacterium]|nr:hypothetical protein [Clostridia bacterium]
MKKRVLAFSLFLLMLALSLCACNVEGNDNSGNVSDGTGGNTFFGLALPEDLNYKGRTVKVLSTSTNDDWSYQIQPASNPNYSADTASGIVTAAAERTRLVEERLGVNIEEEVVYTSNRYGGEMYQRIISDMAIGKGDYLFCMPASTEAAMLSTEGVLLDLTTVETLDITKPWWSQSFNEKVSIAGSVYFTIGDIGYVNKNATLFVAFNKAMVEENHLAEDYGYASLYEMVDEGAWTQDVMFAMSKAVYQDLNENNKSDVGDILGFAQQDGVIACLLSGAGETIATPDADGYPSLTIKNERAISLISDAQEFLQNPQSGFISANDYFNVSGVPVSDVIVPEFKADRLLFLMEAVLNLPLLRDMENDFGVLPTPKYDKEQEEYFSRIGGWSCDTICIPSFVEGEDLEVAGYVLDALGAASRANLNYVYYEQTLQYQISRDDESMRMLDIIFESRIPDMCEIYRWGTMYDTVIGMYKAGKDTFVSAYEKAEPGTIEEMEQTIEIFKSLQEND